MESNFSENDKIVRAKKRVSEIKGFYTHLTVFILVNTFLLIANAGFLTSGFSEDLHLDLEDFSTVFFWGIGLAAHGLYVFKLKSGFFRKWEERKIREYMEKDEEEINKFK